MPKKEFDYLNLIPHKYLLSVLAYVFSKEDKVPKLISNKEHKYVKIRKDAKMKYIKYNPKWPVGTKIVFEDGVKAVFKRPIRKSPTRDGKSLWLTRFTSGKEWNVFSRGYFDLIGNNGYRIVKVTIPSKKKASKK